MKKLIICTLVALLSLNNHATEFKGFWPSEFESYPTKNNVENMDDDITEIALGLIVSPFGIAQDGLNDFKDGYFKDMVKNMGLFAMTPVLSFYGVGALAMTISIRTHFKC